jgi:hypothetical protein
MDYVFSSETSICSNTEPHEHEIRFSGGFDEEEPTPYDKFLKDGLNFYIVFEGTPNITYRSDGSPEQAAEVSRIANYIDSLSDTGLDYDLIDNDIKVYYYSGDNAVNTWHDYDNEWQSDTLPHKIMQGTQSVVFSRFVTETPGSYTIKYTKLVNGSIELNSESQKLTMVIGNNYTINDQSYTNNAKVSVTGNLAFSTTDTAYVAVIQGAE